MRMKRLGTALATTTCMALAASPAAAAPATSASGIVLDCGSYGTFVTDQTGGMATSASGEVLRIGVRGTLKWTVVDCTYLVKGAVYRVSGTLR